MPRPGSSTRQRSRQQFRSLAQTRLRLRRSPRYASGPWRGCARHLRLPGQFRGPHRRPHLCLPRRGQASEVGSRPVHPRCKLRRVYAERAPQHRNGLFELSYRHQHQRQVVPRHRLVRRDLRRPCGTLVRPRGSHLQRSETGPDASVRPLRRASEAPTRATALVSRALDFGLVDRRARSRRTYFWGWEWCFQCGLSLATATALAMVKALVTPECFCKIASNSGRPQLLAARQARGWNLRGDPGDHRLQTEFERFFRVGRALSASVAFVEGPAHRVAAKAYEGPVGFPVAKALRLQSPGHGWKVQDSALAGRCRTGHQACAPSR